MSRKSRTTPRGKGAARKISREADQVSTGYTYSAGSSHTHEAS